MKRADRYQFVEPEPHDRPMCSRFGSGAFPCGPVIKIRINETGSRTALCEAHYVFDVTKTGVSGGPSGFKNRAKNVAAMRLAAAHASEYQALYEAALRELCTTTEPPINADILIPGGAS